MCPCVFVSGSLFHTQFCFQTVGRRVIVADIAFDAALDKEGFEHTDDGAPQEDEGNAAPKVRIGIVPSNGSDGGMVILRVFDNTSASDAGLVPGDIITHWDGGVIESARIRLGAVGSSPSRADDAEAALEGLASRERHVIQRRFYDGCTLRSMGDELGVCLERVRQIQNRALGRMRDAFAA